MQSHYALFHSSCNNTLVIEESKRGRWNVVTHAWLSPGMLLSPLRLITYIYPLLPYGYNRARCILNHLMKKYRSTNGVIFINLYRLHRKVGYKDGRTSPGRDSNQRSLSCQDSSVLHKDVSKHGNYQDRKLN
jgi:hypothetical protein